MAIVIGTLSSMISKHLLNPSVTILEIVIEEAVGKVPEGFSNIMNLKVLSNLSLRTILISNHLSVNQCILSNQYHQNHKFSLKSGVFVKGEI